MTSNKFSYLILFTLFSTNLAFASNKTNKSFLTKVNQVMQAKLPASLIKIQHKVPQGAVLDNSINMQNISMNAVQDLFGPLKGLHSTISADDLHTRNNLLIKILNKLAHKPTHHGISAATAERLAQTAYNHSVVGLDEPTKNKYDPIVNGVRKHGFCFGRADFTYFQLRALGLPKNSIYKLFQVGLITADEPDFGRPWINHNITIVRAKKGGWHAIDPFYITMGHSGVFTLKEWTDLNTSFISNKKSLLFIGLPERVNVQGGTFLKTSIMDRTFPVVRIVKIGADKPKVIEIKDKTYLLYYRDMFNALLASPATKKIVCSEAGWC